MSLQVKTSDKTIREYLNSLDAIIPTYQRSYEWGADQINDFMEDLYEEADTKEDSSRYFFGPVITNTRESDGRKVEEIIDGQQRLTTSTIFLAVLRDMLARHKNNEEANEVRYIIKNELIGDGSKWHPFRLQQKGDLEDEFISHILKPAINSEDLKKIIYHGPKYAGKGKVNNLLRAYNMILSSLEKRLNGCDACQWMRLCGEFPRGSEGSVQSRDGGHAQPPGGPEGSPSHGVAVYLARTGKTKDEIRQYITKNYYPIDFTLNEIRDTYRFNETCQDTVPQAMEAFFESTNFEDVIRNAISVGGDSDTLAAITGSVAEAYYGVPEDMRNRAEEFLDDRLSGIVKEFEQRFPAKVEV